MDHIITEEKDNSHADGNMWQIRKVCTCGWKGPWRAAYNDGQRTCLMRDEELHKKHPNI